MLRMPRIPRDHALTICIIVNCVFAFLGWRRQSASVVRMSKSSRDLITQEVASRVNAWAEYADKRLAHVGVGSSGESQSNIGADRVVQTQWQFGSDGNPFILADGVVLRVGDFCEYGPILAIGRRCVQCPGVCVVLGRSDAVSRFSSGGDYARGIDL